MDSALGGTVDTTVLIVDDEVQLLENISAFLGSFGDRYEVETAKSGLEAIERLQQNPEISIVVTDIRMPEVDGIELVRWCVRNAADIRIVVMTAFGSRGISEVVLRNGAIRFMEKPVDLGVLEQTLQIIVAAQEQSDDLINGLELMDVVQFFSISGESRLLVFHCEENHGLLAFESGRLVHCSTDALEGPDAFFEMMLWGEGHFSVVFDDDDHRYRINISVPIDDLVDEAMRLRDVIDPDSNFDRKPAASISNSGARDDTRSETINNQSPELPNDQGVAGTNTEVRMAISDHIAEFQSIEGFKGVAVFTAQGDMLESIGSQGVDVQAIGMFANNALLNAQKATDQMGVGRGNLMQIRAPQATVVMRCLNEATDFAASKDGKAHFHAVAIMEPEGNTGMAVVMLDRACEKIAEELR